MRRRRLTTALLTIEVALTMVLLAGAGLMMRSFLAVYRADSVVDAARVVAMPLSLPTEKYLRCAWASPRFTERTTMLPWARPSCSTRSTSFRP